MVDEYKKLWTWGSNARGQCGHCEAARAQEPREVSVAVAEAGYHGKGDALKSAEQWEAYVWQRAEVEAGLQQRANRGTNKANNLASEVLVIKDPREVRVAGGQVSGLLIDSIDSLDQVSGLQVQQLALIFTILTTCLPTFRT
jgi:hypothetical protein